MKKILFSILFIGAIASVNAQSRFFTKNGKVSFDATTSTSPEKIVGVNEKATSIIDITTGTMEFAILMKAFNFEKALMQEHFNENYVESDQFPKAVFKGTVVNISTVALAKDGSYPVTVKGMLTMHGETKEIIAEGSLTVKDNAIVAGKSAFKIKLNEFKIEIPSLVKDKLSNDANIVVDLIYQPYKAS